MKREQILEALKLLGVEVDEEKQKDFIKEIQKLNGIDIETVKGENADKDQTIADKDKEIADLKAKFEGQIAEKDAELGKFNVAEIEELKKFKEGVLNKEKEALQLKSLETLIGDEKYHFDKKSVSLISKVALKDGVKFNEKNEIENADEFMSKITDSYKDYIVTESDEGVKVNNGVQHGKVENQPETLKDALVEHYQKK